MSPSPDPKIIKKTLLVLAAVFAIFLATQFILNNVVLPYVLDVTTPVHILGGRVVQNNGVDSLTVQAFNHPIEVIIPKPKDQQVPIRDINGLRPSNPRLLVKSSDQIVNPVRQLSDAPVGTRVTVEIKEDLRKVRKLRVTARAISIIPGPTTLHGVVKNVNGNKIIVDGFLSYLPGPDVAPEPKNQTYTILVNEQTEISAFDTLTRPDFIANNPSYKPVVKIFTLEDLKKEQDLRVNVYTNEDLEKNTTATAIRIEPFIIVR